MDERAPFSRRHNLRRTRFLNYSGDHEQPPGHQKVLRRPKELDALSSPIRARLIQCLELFGPSTILQLAERMDRKPSALYHHLARLVDAGLVLSAGMRPSARRPSAVYRLAARRFVVPAPWLNPGVPARPGTGRGGHAAPGTP
jgi:DNA-binding transcriptional ArsR family regulator